MSTNTSEWYEAFAVREAAGHSPTYKRLANAVAASSEILARLDTLPEVKRQPNLLFASTRALGGPVDAPEPFSEWVLGNWDTLSTTMRTRLTQTNEARRSATLLPLLTSIEGPLALLEVGASAGLCLYPDRWRYRFDDTVIGEPDAPLLSCDPVGHFMAPAHLPQVIWRAGLDLNPLDVTDADDVRWLEALIWPEQIERREKLREAITIAQEDPALLVAGDLNDDLANLAEKAPRDATLVVFHSAVLTYVTPEERTRFVNQVMALPGHWISNEGAGVLPWVTEQVPAGREDTQHRFLTALDGKPVAWSGPHGQSIELL